MLDLITLQNKVRQSIENAFANVPLPDAKNLFSPDADFDDPEHNFIRKQLETQGGQGTTGANTDSLATGGRSGSALKPWQQVTR